MPLEVTTNYETANSSMHRIPVYFIEFADVATRYGTHEAPGISDLKAFMDLPSGVASVINVEEGSASYGSIVAAINDVGGEITALLATGLALRQVIVYAGYWGLAEEDFSQTTLIVDDYKMIPGTTKYEFTFRQPSALTDKEVCIPASTVLVGGIGSGDLSCVGLDTSLYLPAGYFILDNEVLQYSSIADGTYTISVRGALGTTPAAHANGAVIKELIRKTGHLMDIALDTLQNTDKTGCGIDSGLVDAAAFAAVKISLGSGYVFDFRITESFNAKSWLESEICKVAACYMVSNAGKISIVDYQQPSTVTPINSIDESCIRGNVEWEGQVHNLTNVVIYQFDKNL